MGLPEPAQQWGQGSSFVLRPSTRSFLPHLTVQGGLCVQCAPTSSQIKKEACPFPSEKVSWVLPLRRKEVVTAAGT